MTRRRTLEQREARRELFADIALWIGASIGVGAFVWGVWCWWRVLA